MPRSAHTASAFRRWLGFSGLALVLSSCQNSGGTGPAAVSVSPVSVPVTVEATQAPSPRVALLMGNIDYRSNIPSLGQVGNDLADMERLLADLGFRVVVLRNLDRNGLYRAATDQLPRLLDEAGGGTFLLYYSGHGMMFGESGQQEGFLIPVDAAIGAAYDVRPQTVPVAEFLRPLKSAKKVLGLVVLDTCRANPYVLGLGGKGNTEVGTHAPAPAGMLVASATQPGSSAYIRDARNSLYTGHLLRFLGQPGMTIRVALGETAKAVKTESRETQIPWEEGDPSLGWVPLRPATVDKADEAAWAEARRLDTVEGYEGYVHRNPRGGHVREAAMELARLAKRAEPIAPLQPPPAPPASPQIVASAPAEPAVSLPAPPPLAVPALEAKREFRDRFTDGSGSGPEMVVVPKGEFWMGSTKETDGDERYDNEGPRHKVTLGYDLGVGKYAVTFAEWEACVMGGGCGNYQPGDEGWGRGDRPVINVSWEDAQRYVSWLSQRTGQPYRLLSEAEWEYAARAGTTTRRYWGDAIGKNNANCAVCGSQWDGKTTSPVGSFAANGFGLYDMLGNVWQWTADCWHGDYANAPSDGGAWTQACTDNHRVLRGGSWNGIPRYLRSADRFRDAPVNRFFSIGFRVARTLTP